MGAGLALTAKTRFFRASGARRFRIAVDGCMAFCLCLLLWQPRAAAQATPKRPRATSHPGSETVIVKAKARRVTGGGLMQAQTEAKGLSTVTQDFIKTQAPLQNAYQYVQLTPGALVSTSDPFGLSEEFSINLRGLGQDELGYTLDGMPLNDIGYYVAYPSQFIDSENIGEVTLEQGSAPIAAPVLSAAGGVLSIAMRDPSPKPGGLLDLSAGSFGTDREILRLDSGAIGDTGLLGFLSYSHTQSGQWRGPGAVKRQHIDYKLVKEWGDGNRIALTGTYHDGITPNYTLPTLAQFHQYGPKLNYDDSFSPGDANDWKLNVGTFRVLYMSAPSRFTLSDRISLDITPYWQYGYGNSPYGTTLTEQGNFQGVDGPYTVAIPNDAATGGAVMADYTDLQYRAGAIARVTYATGANAVSLGYWYDYSDETDAQPFSGLSAAGLPANLWVDTSAGLIRLPDGSLLLNGQDHVITQTNAVFLTDSLHLLGGRLLLDAGFKEALVSRDATNGVPGPQYRAAIDNAEPLPRLSASYKLTERSQIFANTVTNFRTASEATLFDTYDGGAVTGVANTALKPEYSIAEELGWRYAGPALTASATLFNYNFTNRQIATLVGGSRINESVNAGGQTSRGVDLELGTRRWHGVSLYASGEVLHATIDNDIADGTDYLPTAGKTAVRSPRLQAALAVSYDDGRFFSTVTAKYVGRQYATFMNDESIPGYATLDLAAGYRLPKIGLKARPEMRLNIINAAGADYLSGVANPTTNALPTVGRFGTLIPGSSPSYFLSGGVAALFTLSQAF